MATKTMNIDSAVWSSPGTITFENEATLTFDFGGDTVEDSTGTDDHIATAKVHSIRGLYTLTTKDREAALLALGKIGTEATMTIRIKDAEAATGIQLVVVLSTLRRTFITADHNNVTTYAFEFFARSTDGVTSPVTPTTY